MDKFKGFHREDLVHTCWCRGIAVTAKDTVTTLKKKLSPLAKKE